jgi:CheY-like chemotaxis protein
VRHAGGSAIEVVYRAKAASNGRVLCHWEIRDRGPGLSGQDAEAMFRAWQRGSRSSGSGLGLAIVRGLVEVMGGTVEACARSGGGLSVHVHLPMDAALVDPPPAPTVVDPGNLAFGARILVAEDDRTNQIVIRRQLENLGCTPLVVGNGREALDAMAIETFDLVLLDCQMPVLDGYDACREIRRLETENGKARMPVLAVTAWAMQSDKDHCRESGMDEVLTKPLRRNELSEALAKWLPKPIHA